MATETNTQGGNGPRSSWRRNDLWIVLAGILALWLMVTVIGRLTLAAVVYWVHGRAGYDSGIRVHFVGKTMWFSNGERVPDSVAIAGSFGAFLVSVFVAYLLVFGCKWLYGRLFSNPKTLAA